MCACPPHRLHASLGYQLSLAARVQERRLELGLRQLGLTRVTWAVLLAVGNEARHQPSQIAAYVGIDRTATSRALRRLEREGLIVRAQGPARDARIRTVEITEAGRAMLAKGTPLAIDNNAAMRRTLGAEDHAELLRLLTRLNQDTGAPLSHL